VIDSLYGQAKGRGLGVAWLYCDYLAQREQTAINIMGAILRLLVGREIPEEIRETFQRGGSLLLTDLKRMLKIAIASLVQVFICIDALDEWQSGDLPELLECLRDVVRESPKTRIFLTGRPHVEKTVQRYFTKAVVISITPDQGDIRDYLEKRLGRDVEPGAMSEDLRADIVKIIMGQMSDMYVGVSHYQRRTLTNNSI